MLKQSVYTAILLLTRCLQTLAHAQPIPRHNAKMTASSWYKPDYVLGEGMAFAVPHVIETGSGIRIGKIMHNRIKFEVGYFYSKLDSELLSARSHKILSGTRLRLFSGVHLGTYISISKLDYQKRERSLYRDPSEPLPSLDHDSLWHVSVHISPEIMVIGDRIVWGIRFFDIPHSFSARVDTYDLFVGQLGVKF